MASLLGFATYWLSETKLLMMTGALIFWIVIYAWGAFFCSSMASPSPLLLMLSQASLLSSFKAAWADQTHFFSTTTNRLRWTRSALGLFMTDCVSKMSAFGLQSLWHCFHHVPVHYCQRLCGRGAMYTLLTYDNSLFRFKYDNSLFRFKELLESVVNSPFHRFCLLLASLLIYSRLFNFYGKMTV